MLLLWTFTIQLTRVLFWYACTTSKYNHQFKPLYRSTCIMAPPVKNWRILLVQSFTACMPLLTATSAFVLGRRCFSSVQQCYLHCLRTLLTCIPVPFLTLFGASTERKSMDSWRTRVYLAMAVETMYYSYMIYCPFSSPMNILNSVFLSVHTTKPNCFVTKTLFFI